MSSSESVKRRVKTWLHRTGLLDRAEPIYFNLKTATPSVLVREMRYRIGQAPDGFPVPPPGLVYDVIACRWGSVFWDSGRLIVDDMDAILERNDASLADFDDILDFGCGCGRLIRHVHARTDASLFGSDYNPDLVAWCRAHLPFARFTTNSPAPPLPFEAGAFDYVYARSVLTHLPGDLQRAWMRDLHRVLVPGGRLYLTMHGAPLAEGLSDDDRARFDDGELVVTYAASAGENLCSSYTPRAWVERELLDGFALVEFVEGRDTPHLRQDVYLLRRD